MTSPKNTRNDPKLAWLLGGNPQAIQEQEAEGAAQMLNATTLPVRLNYCTQLEFEELGFTFGDVVREDKLFREATLPEGWTKVGTGHAMWTYIKDERDIERVAIFYKAAFYDRDAFMSLVNVGAKAADAFIYGDDGDKIDVEWFNRLTGEELTKAREEAKDYVKRAEESPHIYGDREPRARKVLEFLDSL